MSDLFPAPDRLRLPGRVQGKRRERHEIAARRRQPHELDPVGRGWRILHGQAELAAAERGLETWRTDAVVIAWS